MPVISDHPPRPAVPAACSEDSACWNWRAMGNHKRLIVTTNGRRMIVGPVVFNRYRDAGHIDRSRTPRLKGDWSS